MKPKTMIISIRDIVIGIYEFTFSDTVDMFTNFEEVFQVKTIKQQIN